MDFSSERIIAGGEQEQDTWQYSLRPRMLNEYIGQKQVKENLEIFIKAAAARHEALDHCLLFGPPGLGKTTLANLLIGLYLPSNGDIFVDNKDYHLVKIFQYFD